MEATLTRSHDQAQPISKDMLAEVWKEVDREIERSLLAGTPEVALNFGRSLVITGHLRGVQLAKLLYELDDHWKRFETDDAVEDAIYKTLGLSKRKFKEYRDVHKYILKDHPQLAGKPIGGLLALVAAARDGIFDDRHWAKLAKCHDKASMVEVRRDARKDPVTKSYTRLIAWCNRDGQLWAQIGEDGDMEHAGWLNVGADPDSAAGKLVARLLNIDITGIVER